MAESLTFNEDCMEVMRRYPDGYFDLAVVDPPYGIGYDKQAGQQGGAQFGNAKAKKRHYHATNWDQSPPDKKYFDELFRVSKNQVIWGG